MFNKSNSLRTVLFSILVFALVVTGASLASQNTSKNNLQIKSETAHSLATYKQKIAQQRKKAAQRRQAHREAIDAKRQAAARLRLSRSLLSANQRRIDLYNGRQQRTAENSASILANIEDNQKYSQKNETTDKKPNILYILTDDQPVKTMSVMRKTMNWFKSEGRIYRNAYVSTPICCPSRAGTMTGQYAHNNKVLNNNGGALFREKIWLRNPFNQDEYRQYDRLPWTKTLQCDLYRNGYKNVLFGKYVNGWRNSSPWNRNGAVPSCFDPQESWMGYDEQHRGAGGTTRDDAVKSHSGSDDYLGGKAVEFIRNQEGSEQPWFAYLSLHSPHLPLAPANRYKNWNPPASLKYKHTAAEIPYSLNGKPGYVKHAAQKKYAANPTGFNTDRYALGQQRMVQSVDDTVQRLRKILKTTKQDRDTVVIFTSDNGLLWGAHGLYNKFYPYIDSIQVPMMIIAPDKVNRGSKDNRIVSNIDIAPTIYDLTNTEPMFHRVDGYSMLGNYRRQWLLTESGDNFVTPYWSAAISRNYHYIETGYDKTLGTEETSETPKVPTHPSQISFKEYYKLNNFRGSQRINSISSPRNNIQQLSERLQFAAWAGPGATSGNRGCYGTVGSDSLNPCP